MQFNDEKKYWSMLFKCSEDKSAVAKTDQRLFSLQPREQNLRTVDSLISLVFDQLFVLSSYVKFN